jgi:alpha-amylase
LYGTHVFDITARSFVIACLVLGPISGCTAHYPEAPTPVPTITGLQIHYANSHQGLSPGLSESLIAYALNSEGIFENVSARAGWTSSDAAIATVANGTVRAVRSGSVDIVANYEGLAAAVKFIVTDASSSFNVFPASTPQVGASVQFRARNGITDVTSQCTWTSSDPGVVTVDNGVVTGKAPGTAAITARLSAATAKTIYLSVPPIRSLP